VGPGEKSVNQFFPGIGGGVIDEGLNFGGRWGESDEIDGEAADKRSAIRFGAGLESVSFEFCENELVNGIAWP
jgi:hypothetical protein